jgi:hypothetical protein
MNGQWLGSRSIRTNWATRKPPAPYSAGEGKSSSNGGGVPTSMRSPSSGGGGGIGGGGSGGIIKPLNYDEMFRQVKVNTIFNGITDLSDINKLGCFSKSCFLKLAWIVRIMLSFGYCNRN